MSGSLEVRQFLIRHETLDQSSPTFGVPTQRNADGARVSDDQVRRARLAVARGAEGVEDCRQLLDMLGLAPGEDGVPPVCR
ncbi:hypothetical protein EV193_103255 [Herbihabitans rhizosphaerae]|uniref:Uncharacterized protein n=1 Tax=Herbihabitans rhizosphaerae TaxID=1872711 RepID=A0A4Q7KWB0_9PSEU|nr:hypothetical protein [Herbihabitans rhizosphaerae]RZS40937.1 hypothetical protein EV193_103255 [Herbihabitans rhizosphaerae]